ncbi:MAG TPA: hypothetical protein IAB70_04300 [Candidatus Merdicola faecigallinarum]|uniref:Uncharacterized protein n=1 Tax=Candidatus Merdicola faecigallinarum TaxID=2840862 RepID=A0A9D1M1F2_9FIRM|nr:hypothetical protein [Candidatus Merdicola faecigallinarum]
MYQIYNKLESAELIEKLNLNVLPQKMFKVNGVQDVEGFLDSHPAQFYSIRDNVKSNSKNRNHKASKEDILNSYQKFDICTVGVSQFNYIDNQVLTGNILIDEKGNVTIEGTNEKCDSAREAVNNAKYHINTDIFDKKLKYINGAYDIIDYVLEHNLQNVVVEFSVFNKNIGVNQEKVLIWELRTNY